jgi:hypothetical protein
MALADILTRTKVINAAISGVTTAYDHTNIPNTLSTANLPAAVSVHESGEHDYYATEGAKDTFEVRMYLFIAPRARAPLYQQYTAAVPFVERFRNAYAAAIKLNSLQYVSHAQLYHHEVRGDLEFEPDVLYFGLIFFLRVVVKEPVTIDV